jgi:hypothetical protein
MLTGQAPRSINAQNARLLTYRLPGIARHAVAWSDVSRRSVATGAVAQVQEAADGEVRSVEFFRYRRDERKTLAP